MINESQQQLSEREQAILRLVATGLSNQQIANQLGISVNTVKVHLRNVFGKIGAASRTEATLYAVRTGLVAVGRNAVPGDLSPAMLPTVEEPLLVETELAHDFVAPAQAAPPAVGDEQVERFDASDANIAVPTTEPARQPRRWLVLLLLGLVALAVVLGGVWASGLLQRNQPAASDATNPSSNAGNPSLEAGWQPLPKLPTPRAAFATANLGDFLYVIGGENAEGVLDSVARYDSRAQVWTELSKKPTSVADVRAVRIGDKLYVPGGRTGANPSDVSDVFERYDPRTERWESLPKLPARRSGYALAALEGNLYLFGGWDGTSYQDSVFVYEPDAEEWSELSPMPTARAFAEAGVVEGNIYVMGGENETGPLAVNEMYSPAQEGAQAWSTRAPMLQPRSRFGSATALSLIHVVGGDTPTPDAPPIKYETRADTWEAFEAAPQPVGSQPGVVMLSTSLVSLGGKQNDAYLDAVQSYKAVYTQSFPRAQ
jgi:DNA-binding CsgD family transcriptional regulator